MNGFSSSFTCRGCVLLCLFSGLFEFIIGSSKITEKVAIEGFLNEAEFEMLHGGGRPVFGNCGRGDLSVDTFSEKSGFVKHNQISYRCSKNLWFFFLEDAKVQSSGRKRTYFRAFCRHCKWTTQWKPQTQLMHIYRGSSKTNCSLGESERTTALTFLGTRSFVHLFICSFV